MPDKNRTSGNGPMPADPRAPCDTNTACKRTMRANADVVADLDLVIEFYPVLDDRIIQGTTVDCCIGANFHVVADHDSPGLGNLEPMISVTCNTTAIRTDDRAGMDDTVAANFASVINGDAGMETCMRSHLYTNSNTATGTDICVMANDCSMSDIDMRGDFRAG